MNRAARQALAARVANAYEAGRADGAVAREAQAADDLRTGKGK